MLVDGAGNRVTSLSGGQSGTLKATVLTPTRPCRQWARSSSSQPRQRAWLHFTPGTGSALTDANGVAIVTVKPASYTAAGALALTATAVADGKTGTGGVNIAIGAAPLTVGTLSFTPAPTGCLPAFSTLSLNIPVTSGGKAGHRVDGPDLELAVHRRRHRHPGAGRDQQWRPAATYTNNGCVRGRDVITASDRQLRARRSRVEVSAANIGAIQFVEHHLPGTFDRAQGLGRPGPLARRPS